MLVGVDTAHFCHLDKLVFFGLNQMYQIDDKSNANLNLTYSKICLKTYIITDSRT